MTAPVPLTLDELLHAVVEACVEEITAARHELATEKAAAAAERRDLEARLVEAEASSLELAKDLEATRSNLKVRLDQRLQDVDTIARLTRELERELTKTAKVGSGSEKREPKLPVSPPPASVEKAVVIPPAPRKGLTDLTGAAVGDFGSAEKTTGRDGLGRILWRFTCTHGCGKFRIWSVQVVATMRNRRQAPKCECQGGAPPYSHSTGRVPMAAAPALPVPTVQKAWSGRGRPPEHVRRERERQSLEAAGARVDHGLDERLDELDTSIGGGDDDLLSRAMAEADGDSFIRRAAAAPARRRPVRDDDQEDEDGSSNEGEKSEPDEDAEEDGVEELDFE